MSARESRRLGAAMLAPAVLYILLIVGLPFLLSIVFAVTDVRVGSTGWRFVGLRNFSDLFSSPSFRQALGNSLLFTVVSQAIVMGAELEKTFSTSSVLRIPIRSKAPTADIAVISGDRTSRTKPKNTTATSARTITI